MKLAALAGISAAVCVAPLPAEIRDYTTRVWQTEDGLPQNSVNSIAQTPDGYLWLATFNGLARFDGVRFTTFDDHNTPALPSSSLIRLDVDVQGGLWIISEAGGLVRWADGQFIRFTAKEGLPASGASAVGRAPNGQVWLRDKEGDLYSLQGGCFVPKNVPGRVYPGPLGSFGFDDRGTLWTRQGRTLARYEDGGYVPLKNPDGESNAVVRAVGSRAQGGLVMVTSVGLQKYRQGKWEPGGVPCPAEMKNLTSLLEDRLGRVWVGTYGNGLFLYDDTAGWRRFTVGNGLVHNAVRSVYEDREGNLWVGTDGGGLHQLRPRLFRCFEAKDGLSGNVIMSVTEDSRGALWFGLNGGGLNRMEAGRFTVLSQPPQFGTNEYVYCVLADRSGRVWAGTYDRGLWCYRDGRAEECPLENGDFHGAILALLEDRAGSVWAGGAGGLWRFEAGRWTRFVLPDALPGNAVHAIAEDSRGALYIGTDGAGVYRWHEKRLTQFTEREGLADNHVTCLWVDAEDIVWVGGSSGGLSRLWQDRLELYSTRTGLPSNRINSILEDDHGRLWVGSERGIFCVRRAEFKEVAAGRRAWVTSRLYGHGDGLSGLECSGGVQPACWKAQDGRLWFATVGGVAVVDPKDLPSNLLAPPVVVEAVALDERLVLGDEWKEAGLRRPKRQPQERVLAAGDPPAPSEHDQRSTGAKPAIARGQSQVLVVPPRINRVEFRFTGLSFVAPEKVRFRYRLEGFDGDWREAGLLRTAPYTRIPPGQYRFRVTACNSDGVWNETGAALGLLVLPPWWMTWWFRTFALAGTAGLIFWIAEARLRRLRREHAAQRALSQRLLESQERERKRIAAELHDSLGQDLLVIKNRALLGLRDSAPSSPPAEHFGEISRMASQSLAEVRGISHDLRPYQLDRLGLTKALNAMVANVSTASGIRCVAKLDSIDGLLSAPLEIHCYRIVQELLNNVVKHSRASEARVSASVREGTILLVVQDDGCGFQPVEARERGPGMGLTDIAERVRILEGALRCDSQRAEGTRWTIHIPITAAPSS